MNFNINDEDVEMVEESKFEKSLQIGIGVESGARSDNKCNECRIVRASFSGMRCKQCSLEAVLLTDPEGKMKRWTRCWNTSANTATFASLLAYLLTLLVSIMIVFGMADTILMELCHCGAA
jgi:hypothetical protein